MAKREHVPETKTTGARQRQPNREQRRHPERIADEPVTREGAEQDLRELGSGGDASVRAKSSGHKKKTADKWNQ